jgi:hypothetical protein
MGFVDKVLKCVECGGEFIFSAGEQMFFRNKGFTNQPSAARSAKRRICRKDEEWWKLGSNGLSVERVPSYLSCPSGMSLCSAGSAFSFGEK